MKAYQVGVIYGEICSIVFAETPSEAKARWEHCGRVDWIEIQCRRAFKFDDLFGKEITLQDYLDRDWFFLCSNCGQKTSLHHEPPTIVVEGKWPCCTEECAEKVKIDTKRERENNALSN